MLNITINMKHKLVITKDIIIYLLSFKTIVTMMITITLTVKEIISIQSILVTCTNLKLITND